MVDFHTHILPEIDDGSPDAKTSAAMLETIFNQGVDRVVATPHFYMIKNDLDSFLNCREQAIKELIAEVEYNENIPKVAVGAEVLLHPEIANVEGIERLCIEGTNYMLTELPFSRWYKSTTYDVLARIVNRGIVPIIAHIERYMYLQNDKDVVFRLIDMGCLIQANGEFFENLITRRKAYYLLKHEAIHFLGSDCHNMENRKPDVNLAYDRIEKKLGAGYIDYIGDMADMVLRNAIYRL